MSTTTARHDDKARLHEVLGEIIPGVCDQCGAIRAIHRRSSGASTSYDTDVVTVQLETGEEFRVFLKDYGYSRISKDGMERRRERELCVYRDLLAAGELGTARYYGAAWDAPRGRFWLFLEFVDGIPVSSCDVDFWVVAANWLGRMHGHFYDRIDRIRGYNFLIIHDAEFFWSRADLALRATSQISPALGERLEKVVGRYGRAVATMTSQPTTLLHGGYRPSNVLVQIRSDPGRVCTVDWEEAALGPPLHDLAYLADGFQPPTLDRLLDAYRKGAQGSGMPLPGRDEIVDIVDCFRLHMVMNMLGRSLISKWSERGVEKLVTMAEQLGCAVS
jgi:hypothetical protein